MHLIISNLDINLIQILNQQIKSRQNKRKTDQGWMQFIFNRLKTSIYSDTTAEYQEHSLSQFLLNISEYKHPRRLGHNFFERFHP